MRSYGGLMELFLGFTRPGKRLQFANLKMAHRTS